MANDTQPLVSVILPTYKRPEFVKRAIQSVLDQTYQNFELIVVDDAPDMPSEVSVKSFTDPRVQYVRHEKNKGCAGAKNTGFRMAKGKYFAILDDDDAWEKEKLEIQVRAMEAAPQDVGFSFTAVTEVFDGGENITSVPEGIADYHDFILSKFNGALSVTLMFRREVFEKSGYMNETFPTHTDAELLIRVTKYFKGLAINTPLVRVTLNKKGHEHMNSSMRKRITGRIMILTKYWPEFKERPEYLARHLTNLARFYRDDGYYKEARKTYGKALELHYASKRAWQYRSMVMRGLPFQIFRFLKGAHVPAFKEVPSDLPKLSDLPWNE